MPKHKVKLAVVNEPIAYDRKTSKVPARKHNGMKIGVVKPKTALM